MRDTYLLSSKDINLDIFTTTFLSCIVIAIAMMYRKELWFVVNQGSFAYYALDYLYHRGQFHVLGLNLFPFIYSERTFVKESLVSYLSRVVSSLFLDYCK
jgi:hypothetical protein